MPRRYRNEQEEMYPNDNARRNQAQAEPTRRAAVIPTLTAAADTVPRYVCVHGHFYQPPRENPWLETVEVQDSAAPYHDWNDRITAECYAPNGASRITDNRKPDHPHRQQLRPHELQLRSHPPQLARR